MFGSSQMGLCRRVNYLSAELHRSKPYHGSPISTITPATHLSSNLSYAMAMFTLRREDPKKALALMTGSTNFV